MPSRNATLVTFHTFKAQLEPTYVICSLKLNRGGSYSEDAAAERSGKLQSADSECLLRPLADQAQCLMEDNLEKLWTAASVL